MTSWTVAHQAPLSMGFSRQEYWSGLPFPSPGDLPNPGIELKSLLYVCISLACMLSHFSCVLLFVTPWTVACQAPLSMGFSRQEYWSGLPCPPPKDLPNPGIKPTCVMSPALQGDSLLLAQPGKPLRLHCCPINRFISTNLSRFHIYALIYICFSLSDLLHSV